MFFAAFVLCITFVIIKLKLEGKTIYKKPHVEKFENSNQNSTLSWVSVIGLQKHRFQGELNLYINVLYAG